MSSGGMGAYVARKLREKRILKECRVELIDDGREYYEVLWWEFSHRRWIARVHYQDMGRPRHRDLYLGPFRNSSRITRLLIDLNIKEWAEELESAEKEKKVYGAWDYQAEQ